MKLSRLSASAALLGLVSLTAAGLKAPSNAAPLAEGSDSLELAQRIGERPGDTLAVEFGEQMFSTRNLIWAPLKSRTCCRTNRST